MIHLFQNYEQVDYARVNSSRDTMNISLIDATDESLAEGRCGILKELIGQIGKGVDIDPPFRVDYGCNIVIGDDFYANFKCVSCGRHSAQSIELIYEM